jgi:phosphoribosylformylglycinamidine synthase
MWQFREAIRGIAEGCKFLGIPVTGGNVSFYNQTGDVAIHPTPVIGVLGVMDDVSKRSRSGFRSDDAHVYLLGTTRDELDGSEWAHVIHKHLGGLPPKVDLAAEQALGAVLVAAAKAGLVEAAHDLSEGGLAVALAEASMRHGVGVIVDGLDRVGVDVDGNPLDPFTALFSESSARALVAVRPGHAAAFEAMLGDVPHARIGVTGGRDLEISGLFSVSVSELRSAHEFTLPAVFGT